MIIRTLKQFEEWLASLNKKEQLKVNARLERIKNLNHYGDAKPLDKGLCELRWKNGWRVYFVLDTTGALLLLTGGNKNDQKKDIAKAKILLGRYT
jgi:putative addiction module killer protein